MDGCFKLIKQIIYAIALIIACVFLISKLSGSRFFVNIKDKFSSDNDTEQVEEIVSEEFTDEVIETEEKPGILDRYTHLLFKNVPIDGSLKSYVAQMENQGFRKYTDYDDITYNHETSEVQEYTYETEPQIEAYNEYQVKMIGDVADFKRCTLYVETLTNKDLVYKILVEFEQKGWEEQKENYTHLKQLLTKKYGTPASCTEKITSEYLDNSCIEDSFKSGLSTYKTLFKTKKGDIKLFINSNYKLTLEYLDKKNSKLITDYASDEL